MLTTIIKRNGTEEEFQPAKLNKWLKWATKEFGKRVDWGMIAQKAIRNLGPKITSQELQRALVDKCVEQRSWAYSRVAGMLYGPMYQKEVFPDGIPSIKELHTKLHLLGYMTRLDYKDDDYQYLETIIDHNRDYSYAYFQLEQFRHKYSIKNRVSGEIYETPQFIFMRMAMALAEDEKENRLEHVTKWYNYFSWCMINAPTPNYTNLGTYNRGLLSCCLYLVDDSIGSLAAGDHIAYVMTAMSAGIGGNLMTRSLNDPVRNGVIKHQGKMPYYDMIGAAVRANRQGGRGGAATTYFSCFDPEAETIIMAQNPRTPIDRQNRKIHFAFMYNTFFARKVMRNEKIFTFNVYTAPDLTDLFFSDDEEEFAKLYEKYENDPKFVKNYVSARTLWNTAKRQTHEVATLYILNITEVNRHTPFKDKIYSSNLCVAPETLLLTDKGHIPIGTLEGQEVRVWNGKQWSKTKVVKTGENQNLWTVYLNDGHYLDCTPYHKWYVVDGYGKLPREVRTHELKPGMKIAKFDLPIIQGKKKMKNPYLNGFYTGDGCRINQHVGRIYLYGDKKNLSEILEPNRKWRVNNSSAGRLELEFSGLYDKYFVPNSDYVVQDRLDWLAGLLDSDGTVLRNGQNESVALNSVNWSFIRETQFMLQTLGVKSKIAIMYDAGDRPMPKNDGSGEYGNYRCRTSYRLVINSYDIQNLIKIGLKLHRLKIEEREVQRSASRFSIVSDIVDHGRISDTYCVTEPLEHKAVFNGILTGQCMEVTQPTKAYKSVADLYRVDHHDGEVSMCGLGGIVEPNIPNDEIYADVAYYTLKMIDKCIHMSDYPLPHIRYTAKNRLNAGVGLVGVAVSMARKNLMYDTPEGRQELHRISERHMYFLIEASLRLGKELGNAPWIDKTKWPEGWLPIDTYRKTVDELATPDYKYDWEDLRSRVIDNGGLRNSTLVNHMPTESSSKASGVPNSYLPIRDLFMNKTDLDNKLEWVAIDDDIIGDQYQRAYDLTISDTLKAYAVIQKFTDQAMSNDLYMNRIKYPELDTKDFIEELRVMTKYGVKGQYYQNSLTAKVKDVNKIEEAAISLEVSEHQEELIGSNDRAHCAGGACSL